MVEMTRSRQFNDPTAYETGVIAKEHIKKGDQVQGLYGLSFELDKNKFQVADFACAARRGKEYLTLGPARFVNHASKSNAKVIFGLLCDRFLMILTQSAMF